MDAEVAAPFRSRAVTSSFAVASGLVDLKRAASFYNSIKIIDHYAFEPRLEAVLGPDYDWLLDRELIEVAELTFSSACRQAILNSTTRRKFNLGLAADCSPYPM